jgi:quinol monooxygenase YgiN
MARKIVIMLCPVVFTLAFLMGCEQVDRQLNPDQGDMLIRISEIVIYPEYLENYLAILKEEAAASVRKEPGVISIFPMSLKEDPNTIRILEIYADEMAYRSHLETSHFRQYKSSTINMVKSLKLVDMEAIDIPAMPLIFEKLRNRTN